MNKWILTLVFCLPYFLRAQNVDSITIKQVDSLIKLNRTLVAQAKFVDAIQVIEIAEKLTLKTFVSNQALYATCLFFHGRTQYFNGQLKEAEQKYLESRLIRELTIGKNNAEYAWSVNNLAGLYWQTGRYELSEKNYLEACLIREKVLGPEHLDYAWSLHNLAILYVDMGEYEKAEPLYLKAKTIREKVLGKNSTDYAYSLNHLAALYKRLGNMEKAELLYLEAKEIFFLIKGNIHPDYAWCISNLSNLYQRMGNLQKAEILILEAISIRKKSLGENHPDYISGLLSLGVLYMDQEEYCEAESLFVKAITIRENVFGKQNNDYAIYIDNLALLYQKQGAYKKSEALFVESKDIRKKIFNSEHSSNAESLALLANLYVEMKDFSKAELYFLKAREIFFTAYGKKNMDYINCSYGLAHLFYLTAKYKEASILLSDVGEIQREMLIKASTYLSEQELSNYVQDFYWKINLNFLVAEKEVDFIESFYNSILFYKGFLLQALGEIKKVMFYDTAVTEQYVQYKSLQRRLGIQYSKPLSDQSGVEELEEKSNALEKIFAKSVNKNGKLIKELDWLEIQEKLKYDEAVLEFVKYDENELLYGKSRYAALMLKNGSRKPSFISLFNECTLDSLLSINQERKADYVNSLYTLADRGAVVIDNPKKSLYEFLWKPLEKELAGVKTIYYSPSGLLHRINLDAIPLSDTETLADRFNLIELNSTRQLVVPTQIKMANNDAVLYGGIRFEQDSILLNNEPLLASRSRGELSFHFVDSTLRGGSWIYLSGTDREVNAIEKIMQTTGVQTKLKKGYEATEESFKDIGTNNSPSPRILHIATHGYFFPDPDRANSAKSGVAHDPDSIRTTSEELVRPPAETAKAASNKPKLEFGTNEPVFKISDHPMLRSGLIMAGGNAAWQGKQTLEGREDGILTAYEISQMNLSNTELVVLSACETGLGDIQGNEGVYGLQRAFKIAGAKYLIMSLWQVPDKQTSLLMTTFYKKWLENKMTIPNAFHTAQKELRDNGLDPYNWAGFVLVE